jgi:hypothetical protein
MDPGRNRPTNIDLIRVMTVRARLRISRGEEELRKLKSVLKHSWGVTVAFKELQTCTLLEAFKKTCKD